MASRIVSLTVNDRQEELLARPGTSLLTVLRETLGLTAAKRGCAQGACGSCTVLLDERPVPACLVPVETVDQRLWVVHRTPSGLDRKGLERVRFVPLVR